MAKILFIGGPLGGRWVEVTHARACIDVDVRLPAPLGGCGQVAQEEFTIATYLRRRLTDGREIFALLGMTDQEAVSKL